MQNADLGRVDSGPEIGRTLLIMTGFSVKREARLSVRTKKGREAVGDSRREESLETIFWMSRR